MHESLFRQKSIDRINSPEQLNNYIRVSNPGVWLVLTAIIILLAGVCVWSVFGRLETRITVAGSCINGILTCYADDADIEKLTQESYLTVNGEKYEITSVGSHAVKAANALNDHIMYLGNFSQDQWLYEITVKTELPDGDYQAEIVAESISPISFIWN